MVRGINKEVIRAVDASELCQGLMHPSIAQHYETLNTSIIKLSHMNLGAHYQSSVLLSFTVNSCVFLGRYGSYRSGRSVCQHADNKYQA